MGINIGQVDPQAMQKLLFGGPQSLLTAPPDAQQPTPQASAPPEPSAQVQQPPQQAQPAQPTVPTAPPASAPQSQPGYSSTPPSFDEYHASHGDVPMAAPPPAPKHGTLAKILLGVGEAVGNPYAREVGERDRSLSLQNQQFQQNKPALQYQANRGAYEQDLGNMEKVADTRGKNIHADVEKENLPLQERASQVHDELAKRWQDAVDPDQNSFQQYAQQRLGAEPFAIQRMLNGDPQHGMPSPLQGITQLPRTGKPYKLNMQDDLPVSIEAYGKTVVPDKNGNFPAGVPPQAIQDFKAAQQAHQTKRGEKTQDEATVAGYAASRQAAGFQQAQTMEATKKMQPAVDTALTADQRLARMEKSYTKGVAGDQQAQLALLADHLGMTFGMQKGAKLNRGLIEEAQQSQPWLAKIGAKFDSNGYLSGVALGPEQMKQMLDLGYDARDQAWKGAHDAATTYGVPLPAGAQQVEKQRPFGAKPLLQSGGQGGGSPEKGFSRVQASDGSMHDVPSDKLDQARKIDPKLKVLQ